MNYYAGIGSRETPDHILGIMHHIGAYLFTQGWTLRSGHAKNADQAFEKGVLTAHDACVDEVPYQLESYLPWFGFNNAGNEDYFVNPRDVPFDQEEIEFTAKFHPAWNKCTPSARLLHTRNTRIVLGCEKLSGELVKPSSFIVAWTEGGELKGGTAQALRIAAALDIPVINLGLAQNPDELEQLVLRVDEYQTKLKDQVIANV